MIYTIGHGNRLFSAFIDLLTNYKIAYLIDVRSVPYSNWQPDFNRETLQNTMVDTIKYIYMGNNLGGRPIEKECYDFTGKVDYIKQRKTESFRQGISRLQKSIGLDLDVCLLCSELNPAKCHRSKCIGVDLLELKIDILHNSYFLLF